MTNMGVYKMGATFLRLGAWLTIIGALSLHCEGYLSTDTLRRSVDRTISIPLSIDRTISIPTTTGRGLGHTDSLVERLAGETCANGDAYEDSKQALADSVEDWPAAGLKLPKICERCNEGFAVNAETGLCEDDICPCTNGWGAKHAAAGTPPCGVDASGDESESKCEYCRTGFYLLSNICRNDENDELHGTLKCICRYGDPVDAMCPATAAEKCDSCWWFYSKERDIKCVKDRTQTIWILGSFGTLGCLLYGFSELLLRNRIKYIQSRADGTWQNDGEGYEDQDGGDGGQAKGFDYE